MIDRDAGADSTGPYEHHLRLTIRSYPYQCLIRLDQADVQHAEMLLTWDLLCVYIMCVPIEIEKKPVQIRGLAHITVVV